MPSQTDDRWLRVGAAAVGLLAGMVLGFCAAILIPEHFAAAVFGAALAGAVTGAAFPEAGMSLGEGTIHFVIGAFTAASWSVGSEVDVGERDVRDRLRWVQAAFCFGLLYGLFWVVMFYV